MNCIYCQTPLSEARLHALNFLDKNINEYDCVQCAEKTTPKVKAFYMGASGISNLIITKKLGDEEHLINNLDNNNIEYYSEDDLD